MKLEEVFRNFIKALNPDSYKILIKKSFRETMQYFSYLILFSLLLTLLIALPFIIKFPGYFSENINHFERFRISINQSMEEPIFLGDYIIIDTTNTTTNLTGEKILITGSKIYSKDKACLLFDLCLFSDVHSKDIRGYSNVLEYEGEIAKSIYILLLLLSPFIFISLFLFYILKYIIPILLLSGIAFVVLLLIKRKMCFTKIMQVGVFASSLMIVIEIINLVLGLQLYYLTKFVFLFYFIVALILNSDRGFE